MAVHLDLADPVFDVTSAVAHQAREQDWYAVTPNGWAVLRYAERTSVLKDERFQQGNAKWPADCTSASATSSPAPDMSVAPPC